MVSSKFTANKLNPKLPSHCKQCPPPGPVPPEHHVAELTGHWTAYVHEAPPPIPWLLTPMTLWVPNRSFTWRNVPDAQPCVINLYWVPSPGRFKLDAKTKPPGQPFHYFFGVSPSPTPEPDFDDLHFSFDYYPAGEFTDLFVSW